jgi:hypothetical protein
MNSTISVSRRACCRAALAACLAASLSPRAGAVQTANILIAGDYLGAQSSVNAVYQFDRQGTEIGTLANTIGKSYFSVTAFGDTIYVGSTGDGIKRFSRTGDFLGYALTGPINLPRVETDALGNLYYIDGSGGGGRLNPDGTASLTFTRPPGFASNKGIDADSTGNVYMIYGGISKFSPTGALLGTTAIPANNPSDMAIDEASAMLYVADEFGGTAAIKAFDISGPLPTFVRSIPTPKGMIGLAFDPGTGHLLATSFFNRAWEIATDGTVVQRYDLDVGGNSVFPFDVAVLPVPEPNALFLGIFAASLPILRPRR